MFGVKYLDQFEPERLLEAVFTTEEKATVWAKSFVTSARLTVVPLEVDPEPFPPVKGYDYDARSVRG